MAILVLAPNVRFVYFDNTHQLLKFGIGKASAQPMTDVPRRLIGARSDHPVNLKRRHALLARQHLVQHFEPRQKRVIGVLKNRAHVQREAINGFMLLADPVIRTSLQSVDFLVAATRALHAIGPTTRQQVILASIVIGKQFLELRKCHLLRQCFSHEPNTSRGATAPFNWYGHPVGANAGHSHPFCS